MQYVVLDCEMGGAGIQYSLLTASFILVDPNFKICDRHNLALKPDDGVYIVSAQGLATNQIDLVEHDKVAVTYSRGATILYNLLHSWSRCGKDKPIPVGMAVHGDIAQICDKLTKKTTWESLMSYRTLDVGCLALEHQRAGRLPLSLSGSLESLCKHFKITYTPHVAESDALATLDVWKMMGT